MPADSQEDPDLAVLVRQLTRYCESELSLYPPPALTRIEQRVAGYRTYLQQVRGFAPSTLAHHGRTAGEFLAHIGYETHPARLAALERQGLDTFLCAVGPRQSRASLQHVVAHLRAFLRFLAAAGEIPTGLDTQIDTPRVYRGEQLPRALPWDTVRALLQSIDRLDRVLPPVRRAPRGCGQCAIYRPLRRPRYGPPRRGRCAMTAAGPNDLARALRAFFAEHLPRVRGTSPHTIQSYRDSLVLLLRFVSTQTQRSVIQLDLDDLGPQPILAFLQYLELDRHNSVATRNVRLAVVRSVRRVVLHLPRSTPHLEAWRHIARALGARAG